jgi:predicted nucleotidyltransferase
MKTLSLAEIDKRRRERREAGLQDVERRLRAHAHGCSGRYILHGSAARGDWRATSDVDILVDFPRERRLAGLLFAESACAEVGLRGDVRPLDSAPDRLIARALAEGRILA